MIDISSSSIVTRMLDNNGILSNKESTSAGSKDSNSACVILLKSLGLSFLMLCTCLEAVFFFTTLLRVSHIALLASVGIAFFLLFYPYLCQVL